MADIENFYTNPAYWGGHGLGDDCPAAGIKIPEEVSSRTYEFSDAAFRVVRPDLSRAILVGSVDPIIDATTLPPGLVIKREREIVNLRQIYGPEDMRYERIWDVGIISPGESDRPEDQKIIFYTEADTRSGFIRSVGETRMPVREVRHTKGFISGVQVDTLDRVGMVYPIGLVPPRPPRRGKKRGRLSLAFQPRPRLALS